MTDPSAPVHANRTSVEPRAAPLGMALIAIKDSTAALHAFYQALCLSRELGLRLAAVTVAPLYQGDLSIAPALGAGSTGPYRTILDEALEIARSQGAGLQTFLSQGEIVPSILNLARQGGFDLIIAGRGAGWLPPFNTPTQLLRQSPIDVLVIPEKQPLRLDRIACATTPSLAEAVRRRAVRLTRGNTSTPEHQPPAAPMLPIQLCKDSPALYRHCTPLLRAGGIDLLLLGESTPTHLFHCMKRSAAARLLARPACPLWVVKQPATDQHEN